MARLKSLLAGILLSGALSFGAVAAGATQISLDSAALPISMPRSKPALSPRKSEGPRSPNRYCRRAAVALQNGAALAVEMTCALVLPEG